MDYFTQIAEGIDRPERLEMARREGRKTVALVGVAVPEELFWACGAVPISLGRFVAETGADRPAIELPRDVCAAARTSFNLLARWVANALVDAVVAAGGCDWIARIGNRLDERVPVWPLSVARTNASIAQGASLPQSRLGSLETMLDALERLTDLPLTRRAFAAAHQRAVALEALCDRLGDLRAGSPPALLASDYYRIIGSLGLADPQRWSEAVRDLLARSQSAIRSPQSAIGSPRVLLWGCPTGFPDTSLVELIEQTGFQIVGEDLRAHGNGGGGQRKLRRGGRCAILEWTAEALDFGLRMADCGLAGPENDAESALLGLMAGRRADGVIRLHYRGCAVNAMEAARLQPRLAERGVAVLAIEIEQVPAASEALRTRLEAFREQLTSQ